MTAASVGLLAGARSKTVVYLFMTDEALSSFEASSGWTVGADASVTLLTVGANAAIAAIHDRMPAILAPEAFDAWLDCRGVPAGAAAALLRPAPEALLEVVEVSARLNNPRNEGPDLLTQDRTTLL